MLEEAPAAEDDEDRGSHCVLVVEDNPEFRTHLSNAVQGLGSEWTVDAVGCAQEAIARIHAAQEPYRLALIDIGLPDKTGIEVIRAVSSQQPGVPVLVISILSTEETVLAAIRAGARGYLLKDDSVSTIRTAVTQLLNDQYPISPALARYLFRMVKASVEDTNVQLLTARELEVLVSLSQGMTYPEIAEAFDLSISTIRTHIQMIYRKLNAKTGNEAVAVAKNKQLI